jgi:hypothetical protein
MPLVQVLQTVVVDPLALVRMVGPDHLHKEVEISSQYMQQVPQIIDIRIITMGLETATATETPLDFQPWLQGPWPLSLHIYSLLI